MTDKAPVQIAPGKLEFYRMVLQQLKDDGLGDEGSALSHRLKLQIDQDADVGMFGAVQQVQTRNKDQLYEMFENHVSQSVSVDGGRKNWVSMKCKPYPPVAPQEDLLDLRVVDEGDNFEMDAQDENTEGMDVADYMQEIHGKPVPNIKLRFASQHKQGIRSVAFSHDGRLCASASVDTSIKVMETSKMRMHSVQDSSLRPVTQTPVDDLRPVIRTFYDHVAAVTSVAFHPKLPILYSGSVDKTVKVYDLTRATQNKKAQSSVTDVSPINVLSTHPCGDFLFVGTQHKVVRLYDTTTMQCYSSYHHASQHSGAVYDIRSSADGSMFASVGADGCIFLWDGVNHRVVNRIPHAHAGQAVFNCQWSRNQRYLLTSGGDNKGRLWDLRTGKLLQIYSPVSTSNQCEFMTASFAAQEKFILLGSSEITDGGDLTVLDAKSGNHLVKKLSQHEKPVRCISACPTDKTFLTGSEDGKVRYFDIDTSGVASDLADQQYAYEQTTAGGSGFIQHIGL